MNEPRSRRSPSTAARAAPAAVHTGNRTDGSGTGSSTAARAAPAAILRRVAAVLGMRLPPCAAVAAPAAIAAVAALACLPAAARGQTETPRTPWGAPDLNGVWNHGTATPLERPERHGGRERLTEAEIAEINAAQRSTDGVGARRAVWWERSLSDGRTSLIVDPPDGRIPYSGAGEERVRARPGQTSEGPEGRSPQERCISYGIPRLGGPYSQNVHVAQTPDHVLLLHEMVHEFRIVPLDGRPRLPGRVRQWLGDSRGRWEGDTLVVETANFSPAQWFRGLSQGGMRLVERFTRVDRGTLRYEVTFDDPGLWTQPWTAVLRMPPTQGAMFEFACHEGNTGMTALLEIARLEEAAAGGTR